MVTTAPHDELPPVDARLVASESGFEAIDGRLVEVAPADEPHGTRHAKISALLEAFVRDEFDTACDMLTRTSKTSDIAPDASVFPRARDPHTQGRQLEQLAFEVVSTQSLGKAADKARRLSERGVRRVFAVDVGRTRVLEWSAETGGWAVLSDAGSIDDPCFVTPLPTEALVKAARTDDAVARALLAKRNPVLQEVESQAEQRGLEQGLEQGLELGLEQGLAALQRAIVRGLEARGFALSQAEATRIRGCRDIAQLERWASAVVTVSSAEQLFDEA